MKRFENHMKEFDVKDKQILTDINFLEDLMCSMMKIQRFEKECVISGKRFSHSDRFQQGAKFYSMSAPKTVLFICYSSTR